MCTAGTPFPSILCLLKVTRQGLEPRANNDSDLRFRLFTSHPFASSLKFGNIRALKYLKRRLLMLDRCTGKSIVFTNQERTSRPLNPICPFMTEQPSDACYVFSAESIQGKPTCSITTSKMEWSARFYPGFMLHRPNRAWFSLSLFGQNSTCVNSLRPTGIKSNRLIIKELYIPSNGIDNYTTHWHRSKVVSNVGLEPTIFFFISQRDALNLKW